MARRKKKTGLLLAWTSEKPSVTLIWVAPSGEVCRSVREWKRPCTDAALADWMADYEARVAAGYMPEGFDEPPMPHCARVEMLHRVLAEWNRPLTLREIGRMEGRKVG